MIFRYVVINTNTGTTHAISAKAIPFVNGVHAPLCHTKLRAEVRCNNTAEVTCGGCERRLKQFAAQGDVVERMGPQ